MEFKQPKKKRSINFSDPVVPVKPAPKKRLKWFEDDKELKDLRANVKDDALGKKPKGRLARLFSKPETAFDDPTKTHPKKTQKVAKIVKQKSKKLNIDKSKIYAKKYKKQIAIGVFALIIAIIGLNKVVFNGSDQSATEGASITAPKTGADLPREKPNFKILYPGNKNNNSVGEIVKVSPPNTAPAYTYIDKVGDVQVNVTQQELPGNFKVNQDGELEKLTKNFQATSIIQVDSLRVYHGESSSGVQSLVFIKGNLLITIKSSQKLGDEAWAAYISALHS